MVDIFDNIQIVDATLRIRSVEWLRQKYGPGITYQVSGPVQLIKVWESSATMTIVQEFRNALNDNTPMPNLPVEWGWPGSLLDFETNAEGKSEFPMGAGGHYDPATQTGPHWFACTQSLFRVKVEGMGWVDLTNHDHLNFMWLVGGAAPPPPPSGGTVSGAELSSLADTLQGVVTRLRDLALQVG